MNEQIQEAWRTNESDVSSSQWIDRVNVCQVYLADYTEDYWAADGGLNALQWFSLQSPSFYTFNTYTNAFCFLLPESGALLFVF